MSNTRPVRTINTSRLTAIPIRILLLTITAVLLTTSCGGEDSPQSEAAARRLLLSQKHPDIVNATFDAIGGAKWSVRVTLSSPYDTPERYADAWRVLSLDGDQLGIRELTHDHENEQPFTRALNNVEIPIGTDAVLIEARDLINGWSGEQVEFTLPSER